MPGSWYKSHLPSRVRAIVQQGRCALHMAYLGSPEPSRVWPQHKNKMNFSKVHRPRSRVFPLATGHRGGTLRGMLMVPATVLLSPGKGEQVLCCVILLVKHFFFESSLFLETNKRLLKNILCLLLRRTLQSDPKNGANALTAFLFPQSPKALLSPFPFSIPAVNTFQGDLESPDIDSI